MFGLRRVVTKKIHTYNLPLILIELLSDVLRLWGHLIDRENRARNHSGLRFWLTIYTAYRSTSARGGGLLRNPSI